MTEQKRNELVNFWLDVQSLLIGIVKGGLVECGKGLDEEDTFEVGKMSLTAAGMFLGELCAGSQKTESEAKELLSYITGLAGNTIHKIITDKEAAEPGEEGGAS